MDQHSFKMNVSAGNVGVCLIVPYGLPARLTGAVYRDFIQKTLLDLEHKDESLQKSGLCMMGLKHTLVPLFEIHWQVYTTKRW